MNNPNKKRLRRTMMFLNAQKPGLIKDPYIYKADSLMLDLEDAVAENQKDVARFSLYHALKTVDYRGAERVVRINGLDTPYWREDIRACVAGGCDSIRIPKTEHAEDVRRVAAAVYTDLKDMDGFRKDVENIHLMGFDGKSIINPRQIPIVHEIFTPTQKDIIFAEKVVKEIDSKKALGIGVFTVDGKMIDIAFYDGAKRTIDLAKASGVYKGDL